MRGIAACLLLCALGGCAGQQLEPVKLDTKNVIFDSEGKCRQFIGTRTVDVECPPKPAK